tara:strand:- start:22977 stop:23582 length:606 start_codon:yes stop_codon:yes gene_type:complete
MTDKDHNNTALLGVILAGGNSQRMGGGHKFLLSLCGTRIIDHVINSMSPQVDTLIVSANHEDLDTPLEVVPDLIKDAGPLGGIYTALMLAKERGYSKIVTAPADTPFIPDDFVSRLYAHSKNPIVVAKSDGQIHPVLALWDTELLDDIEMALKNGERKMLSLIKKYRPVQVDWTDERDPFFNINTPQDLDEAEKRLAQANF